MNKTNRTYVVLGLTVFGLIITYILAAQVVPRVLVTFTKAAPATQVSLGDSLILGEKILATADGVDSCKINVYILDSSGKGVAKKGVSMEGLDNITPAIVATDSDGKATFTVTSTSEGQYTLVATVDGVKLPRNIKVTFRK